MSHTLRQYVTSDAATLNYRYYQPEQTVRGIVVAVHGIQSHSGWYQYSSQRLAGAGYVVYFADRRGSGENAVDRGHADHGLRLVHDVRQLLQLAQREHPNLPTTLLGLSWGGKLAAACAALLPHLIQQLILLYPAIRPRLQPNLWQSLLLNFARRHDIRRRAVKLPLTDPALFTDVPEHQQQIAADPLALHSVTTGLLNAGRDLDHVIQQHANQIRQRTLLMLAGKDQIIDNQKTRRSVASFASTDLQIREYPNAAHTLEFDSRRKQIFADLIHWLRAPVDSCCPKIQPP